MNSALQQAQAKEARKALFSKLKDTSIFCLKVLANLCMIPTSKPAAKTLGTAALNIATFTAAKGDSSKLLQYKVSAAVIDHMSKKPQRPTTPVPTSIIKKPIVRQVTPNSNTSPTTSKPKREFKPTRMAGDFDR